MGGQAVVGHLDIDALGLARIHAHGSPFSNPKRVNLKGYLDLGCLLRERRNLLVEDSKEI